MLGGDVIGIMADASYTKRFSIHTQNHRKALDYLAKWSENRDNVSDKICRGIEKIGEEEDRAQLSLDDIANDQRRKEVQNQKVEDFITMIHRDGDWQELMKKFDLEQLLRLKAEVGVYYEQIDAAVHFEVDRQERDRKFLASTHRFERSNRGRYDSNME